MKITQLRKESAINKAKAHGLTDAKAMGMVRAMTPDLEKLDFVGARRTGMSYLALAGVESVIGVLMGYPELPGYYWVREINSDGKGEVGVWQVAQFTGPSVWLTGYDPPFAPQEFIWGHGPLPAPVYE